MLTLKSPFSEYMKLLSTKTACGSITPFNDVIKKLNVEKITVDEAYDVLNKEPIPELWIIWLLENLGKELGPDIRMRLFTKIVKPTTALRIFMDFVFLTDEEDIMLKKMFKGKLPTAEKEISTGVVIRSKK